MAWEIIMSTRIYFEDKLSVDNDTYPHIVLNSLYTSKNQCGVNVSFDPQKGFYLKIDHDPLFEVFDLKLFESLKGSVKEITFLKFLDPSNEKNEKLLFLKGIKLGKYFLRNKNEDPKGEVVIGEYGVNLQIFIRADSVEDFNKIVQALKNGTLIKTGDSLNQYEALKAEYERTSETLTNAEQEISRLEDNAKLMKDTIQELRRSVCYKIKESMNVLILKLKRKYQ